MPATMTQIAEESGVSVSLVSRLLRGDNSVRTSKATRQRVRETCRRLGGANSLPGTQRRGLHVTVPINRTMPAHVVTPISQRPDMIAFDRFLREDGGQININFFDPQKRLETFRQLIEETDYCQGLLLHRKLAEPALERMITTNKFPHVCIDPAADRFQLNTLFADERGGAMQVVAHLIGFDHKRIGYVGYRRSSRFRLFESALNDEGLPLKTEDVCVIDVADDKRDDDHTAWRQAAQKSFIDWTQSAQGIQCTALYCQNDAMALGVIDAMEELGMVPGRDLSVIGNDDIEARGGMYGVITSGKPFLTTIHNPLEEVGLRAAQWLLEQHLGEAKRIVHERIPTRLVMRKTTGPVNTNKNSVLLNA